jgi:hydroxymethylpyrimidine pyrophosphatase-like HAD family hydrolase
MDSRSRAWRYYRAVGLDLDGTIACGGPPEESVLAAIDAARADGIRVVLVTGRILSELEAEFPGITVRFDAVCAENGAVLAVDGMIHRLARALDPRLERLLTDRGVAVRTGEVLLACDADAAHLAMDAIHQLQLDAQLVRNREALMILPAGVTKGTGVTDTLGRLGV